MLEQLVRQLGLRDVTMMVQDWGGPIGGYLIRERNVFVERIFPHHRTVLLEGAGHYIQEDAPEEIVAAIRSWQPR